MAVSRSIKDSSCKSAFWSQPNWILCMLPKVLDRSSFHRIELGCMAKCISIMSTSNRRCVPWISLYLVICHHLLRIARSSGGLGAWNQMIQDDSRWQITNTKGNQKWGESYFYFSDICHMYSMRWSYSTCAGHRSSMNITLRVSLTVCISLARKEQSTVNLEAQSGLEEVHPMNWSMTIHTSDVDIVFRRERCHKYYLLNFANTTLPWHRLNVLSCCFERPLP